MKKWTLVMIAVATAAVVSALAVRAMREEPEWTTASAAALDAFRDGLAAEKKLYSNDAREHFARAVELDPDFAMARFKLIGLTVKPPERPVRMKEFISRVDMDRLNPRERFLLQHRLALIEEDRERASRLLEEYLTRYPDDLYALWIRCDGSWSSGSLDRAESCYARMLELDPQFAWAQNHLGYLKMAKGDFPAAEQAFFAYKQLAPDQANPHDSLGELKMLLGRYDEARQEFEEAVRIRPDFCASYAHLIDLALLQGRLADARELQKRAGQAVCPPEFLRSQDCRLTFWEGVAERDVPAALRPVRDASCTAGDFDMLTLPAIYGRGLAEGDDLVVATVDRMVVKMKSMYGEGGARAALLDHLAGIEAESRGDLAAAVQAMERADARLNYNGESVGLLKLSNRLALARLYDRTGRSAEAAQLREDVRRVNPAFETFEARASAR